MPLLSYTCWWWWPVVTTACVLNKRQSLYGACLCDLLTCSRRVGQQAVTRSDLVPKTQRRPSASLEVSRGLSRDRVDPWPTGLITGVIELVWARPNDVSGYPGPVKRTSKVLKPSRQRDSRQRDPRVSGGPPASGPLASVTPAKPRVHRDARPALVCVLRVQAASVVVNLYARPASPLDNLTRVAQGRTTPADATVLKKDRITLWVF